MVAILKQQHLQIRTLEVFFLIPICIFVFAYFSLNMCNVRKDKVEAFHIQTSTCVDGIMIILPSQACNCSASSEDSCLSDKHIDSQLLSVGLLSAVDNMIIHSDGRKTTIHPLYYWYPLNTNKKQLLTTQDYM